VKTFAGPSHLRFPLEQNQPRTPSRPDKREGTRVALFSAIPEKGALHKSLPGQVW
jgi:hypothetical protein